MEKIQSFILKSKKIFIGLEDSKKSWKICVRYNRMEVHYISMEAKIDILSNYLKNKFPACNITIIYEAGFRGFSIHDQLTERGFNCIVTPPNKVTEEKGNKVKTDKIDARRLAKVLENDDYKACFVPDKELRDDREASRTLIKIQNNIVRTKNQIRKFLDLHNISIDLPNGKWGEKRYKELKFINIPKSLSFPFEYHINMLNFLKEQRKIFKEKLKDLCQKPRYEKSFKLLKSFPGIGWQTAIRLILEWGEDMSRFQTGKKIASYSGLTGSEYSTGEKVIKGPITRQSNKYVRSWLIECAWTSIRKDPALLKKFNSIYSRNGSKKKAIVAVARKLVVRIRAVLLSGIPYELGKLV